jgi:hypothetical protein
MSSAPPSIAPIAPIDIMESERLWRPSLAALGVPPFHEGDVGKARMEAAGTLRDSVVRWPRFGATDRGLIAASLLVCVAGTFLCLSAPNVKPLAEGGCKDDLDGAGVVAMFLNVI